MKFIFYAGFLFFGGGFLVALFQYFAYNGFGNVFEYVKADNAKIKSEITFSNKIEITNIYYLYTVSDKLYESKESIATSSIKERGVRIDEIYYNRTFPSFNYVGDKILSLRKAKTGMVVMSVFFLFIFLIYKYADMDKWVGVYTRGEYKSSRK
jgi:hypothetical protein